jgi:hypothetical protein
MLTLALAWFYFLKFFYSIFFVFGMEFSDLGRAIEELRRGMAKPEPFVLLCRKKLGDDDVRAFGLELGDQCDILEPHPRRAAPSSASGAPRPCRSTLQRYLSEEKRSEENRSALRERPRSKVNTIHFHLFHFFLFFFFFFFFFFLRLPSFAFFNILF